MKLFHSRLFRLIITVVSFLLVVSLSRSIMSLWGKYDIVRERQQELDREKDRNAKLKAEFREVQRLEFIEREAREKLGMVKEGEAIVLMPNDKLQMTNGEKEEKVQEVIPKWKQWWKLFF